jgi:hypothetical protein
MWVNDWNFTLHIVNKSKAFVGIIFDKTCYKFLLVRLYVQSEAEAIDHLTRVIHHHPPNVRSVDCMPQMIVRLEQVHDATMNFRVMLEFRV